MAFLLSKLTQVTLESRKQLYAAGCAIDAVYFVESGMISLMASPEDGMPIEVGTVGRDGMLGTSLVLGNGTAYFEAVVQMPGSALCMGVRDFRNATEASPPLRDLLLRHSEVSHLQAMQTSACNGRHGLNQRLARWLLMAHDQVDGSDIPLMHESLAMMLGVHRPSVTVAAHRLQRMGVIKQAKGCLTVVDRSGLEDAACECYSIIRRWSKIVLGSAKD